MGASIADRFFQIVENEAERLKQEEGNVLNPTGVKEFEDSVFKDHCRYVYSLHNLDAACYALASFQESLSKRSEQDKDRSNYLQDLKRSMDVPCKMAFYLRGYVGAFSEENFVLQEDKLQDLQNMLMSWLAESGNSGKIQEKVYQFLWDYAQTQICDEDNSIVGKEHTMSQDEKNGYIKYRVDREIKAFKEILDISCTIVGDVFNSVWDGYENDFKSQQEEKVSQQEYIDKIVDEKLQQVRADIQRWGSLVEQIGKLQGETSNSLHESIMDLYKRINGTQGQPVQQQRTHCPHCGTKLFDPQGQKFCTGCRKPI